MPQPAIQSVHVDRPLTNISVAYMQDHADFLADRLFPIVPVQKKSDSYFKYDKGFWFRDQAKKRAPGSESAGGGYGVTPDTYNCEVWAFHKDVDNQTRANTDNPLDADRDATQFVTEILLLRREKLFLDSYFKTGVWGADVTPGTLWSAANSTPIDDVDAQSLAIKRKTGKWPNRLALGADVYKVLKNHSTILERIKYTQRATVTPELLAALMAPPNQDGFQVMVAAAIENTGKEGQAENMVFAADEDDALLCYAEPNPGIQKPSAGYIFSWAGLLGADAFYGNRIARIPTPLLGEGSERVEGELAIDMKVVGSDLGVFFNEAVA